MMVWRATQGIGYAGLCSVGTIFLIDPSEIITEQMGSMAPYFSTMLLVGGLLGFLAMATRVWAFETTGLPFLYSSIGMWGIALLRQLPFTSARFAYGVFLLSIAFLLFAHWRAVYKFGDEAIEARLYEKRFRDGQH